ncbi:hypothetical protein E2562_031380 [Oryza meyeriana var. granulata]|uniref:Uncharacterized protein n=1 Tax=Oryza meyeriana var. granulata TaxID=110450 RepID=A0A6G1DRQ2_9ORYZ|nr:hypothetical protein E2562_031380 [Oryza meyeriana var. granulata]
MKPVVSCYNISCLQAAAVRCRSPASPSMRRRRRLTPATHPAALLPFSTAPHKYGLPRHRFAPPAAINISPDALVHPARESERQKKRGNTEEEIITETKDSVVLQFPVTKIVGGDESKVNNAIKVAINHGDVLTISLKEEEKQKRQPSLLDVRLLMTPGYEKVEWQSKKVGEKVLLVVTIKKKAPADVETSIVNISAIEEEIS